MKFASVPFPGNCPWGQLEKTPSEIRPGIWFIHAELQRGVCLSLHRLVAIKKKFPKFFPENGRWWGEDADMAVVVAAFPKAFSDRYCYVAYHSILSNAQWEERFQHVADLCEGTEIHRRSVKYAADNKRFYARSEFLGVYGDQLKLRLVRESDGHAVIVLADREWAFENSLYSEAEVSMYLVAPDL